jgi:Domain of unknown function (DUF4279)
MNREYSHDYATCGETYATLCVYHHDLDPEAVTALLGLQPSRAQRRGDLRKPNSTHPVPIGGWFLTTEDELDSRDVRYHIDALLDKLRDKGGELQRLAQDGCTIRINCYWESAHGHGGPMLWPETMRLLGELGIELGFDVYFHGGDERKPGC